MGIQVKSDIRFLFVSCCTICIFYQLSGCRHTVLFLLINYVRKFEILLVLFCISYLILYQDISRFQSYV